MEKKAEPAPAFAPNTMWEKPEPAPAPAPAAKNAVEKKAGPAPAPAAPEAK